MGRIFQGTAVNPTTINQGRIIAVRSDGQLALAASATDALIGIFDSWEGFASAYVDVDGLREVELGGAVNAGDPITSDANGRAIKATPPAGVNYRIVGYAMESGAAGDVVKIHTSPGTIQG